MVYCKKSVWTEIGHSRSLVQMNQTPGVKTSSMFPIIFNQIMVMGGKKKNYEYKFILKWKSQCDRSDICVQVRCNTCDDSSSSIWMPSFLSHLMSRAAIHYCCSSQSDLLWKWLHLVCHHIPTYPLIHAAVTVQWAAGKMNTYLCLWKCSHCRLKGHTPEKLHVSQSWGCWENVLL